MLLYRAQSTEYGVQESRFGDWLDWPTIMAVHGIGCVAKPGLCEKITTHPQAW